VNGCGCRRRTGSPAETDHWRSRGDLRVTEGRCGRWRKAWRDGGALRRCGPGAAVRRGMKLSPQAGTRLEMELRKGRWRTGSLMTSGGRRAGSDADRPLFPRRLTPPRGVAADAPPWLVLPGPGPAGRLERDDEAVAVWKTRLARYKKHGARPGRLHLLRGRGRPGPEAAERPHLGAARAPAGGRVRGAGGGRVSIAGVACYRPGDGRNLYYHLLVYRRRKGEARGSLGRLPGPDPCRPTASCPPRWSGSGTTSTSTWPGAGGLAEENKAWLRVYRLPAYAPDLIGGGHLVAAQAVDGQLRRRWTGRPGPHRQAQAEEDQYRPHLIDGCLAGTGL